MKHIGPRGNELVTPVQIDKVFFGHTPIADSIPLCAEKITLQKTPELIINLDVTQKWDFKVFELDYDVVKIDVDTFKMGCPKKLSNFCNNNEKPQHKVKLTNNFVIMKTEVTQELYTKVMKTNPSRFDFRYPSHPVETVTWYESIKFANKLSETEGFKPCYIVDQDYVEWDKDCRGWRLPTEAEWEFVAQSAQHPMDINEYFSSTSVAWFKDNSLNRTHPVCHKLINKLGVCDMQGNVSEWVWDFYDESYYSREISDDPTGPLTGRLRVIRGGSWWDSKADLRVTNRMVPPIDNSGDR